MSPVTITVVAIAAALLLIASLALARLAAAGMSSSSSLRRFLKHGRQPGTRAVVVCAGDSLTIATVSANYVERLAARFEGQGVEFVNAGVNGDLAWNVLQRLDEIVACRPDVVTVLIGTNDVMATYDDTAANNYIREKVLPVRPTLAWYRENITLIVERLQAETGAEIALIDLPMLGEDLDSAMNARVAEYNAVLREIAAEKRVAVLALNGALRRHIPAGHSPRTYDGDRGIIMRAALQHQFLFRSWDAVSRGHGLLLLTDNVHLNDTASAVLAEVVGDYLEGLVPQVA